MVTECKREWIPCPGSSKTELAIVLEILLLLALLEQQGWKCLQSRVGVQVDDALVPLFTVRS